jgi:hypothetical protein
MACGLWLVAIVVWEGPQHPLSQMQSRRRRERRSSKKERGKIEGEGKGKE